MKNDHGDGIRTIDTGLIRPGFDASHLVIDGGRAAFVDCGVNDSVPILLSALEENNLDIGVVDYLFLSHVHLDHAGGAGKLMMALPNAKAVLHPRGAPHMIDPTKLIKGSVGVYGEKAYRELYGDIIPIPAQRVIVAADRQEFLLGQRIFKSIYTEGHARHHHCFHDPQTQSIFTGDSFGVSFRELDTSLGEFIFPTTTPIHFDPAEAHRAIDTILDFNPKRLFLTHYSLVEDIQRLAGDLHKRIDDFVAIAKKHANDENRTDAIRKSMFRYFERELEEHHFYKGAAVAREIVEKDVILNTMGLEFWLDHT